MRKAVLKRIIDEIGLSPNKLLGQHFLASEELAKKIVNTASIKENDYVVEVGPGLGVVTENLIKTGADVFAIEIDKKLSHYLRNRFSSNKNLHLIEDDFFNIDMKKLLTSSDTGRMKFISNPPYRGAKKLLRKLVKINTFSLCILTLQKEIADDILQTPGKDDSKRLTYYIHYRFKPKKLFDIPPNFFYPEPRVNSSVILLHNFEPEERAVDDDFYFKTVNILLSKRKKKLKNNIKSGFHITYDSITKMLINCKLDNNVRPNNLSIQQMIKLSNLLKGEL